MELKRYSLIVRRWIWFLAIVVGFAALFTWLFITQTGIASDRTEAASLVLLVTVVGVVWGLIGIFGIEALIDNVKTVADVRKVTSAPLLAALEMDRRSTNGASPFVVLEDPSAAAARAYREASDTLLPAGPRGSGRTILVCATQTSPHTARVGANLAAATALAGYPTLLIDANRAEGELSSTLNLADQLGFGDAISDPRGDIMLHLVPSIPNLHVLPAGTPSMDEPLTFTGAHLRAVIDRSGAYGAAVIIVGPPTGAQAHSLGMRLARAVDEVVLLVVADETKRKTLRNTISTFREVRANLSGIIFVRPTGSRLRGALSGLARRGGKEPARRRAAAAGGPQEAAPAAFTRFYDEPEEVIVQGPGTPAAYPDAEITPGPRQISALELYGEPPFRGMPAGAEVDLSGLDTLGGKALPGEAESQDLNLSDLDTLGGELAGEMPPAVPLIKPAEAEEPRPATSVPPRPQRSAGPPWSPEPSSVIELGPRGSADEAEPSTDGAVPVPTRPDGAPQPTPVTRRAEEAETRTPLRTGMGEREVPPRPTVIAAGPASEAPAQSTVRVPPRTDEPPAQTTTPPSWSTEPEPAARPAGSGWTFGSRTQVPRVEEPARRWAGETPPRTQPEQQPERPQETAASTGATGSSYPDGYGEDVPVVRRFLEVAGKWIAALALWLRVQFSSRRTLTTRRPRRVNVLREAGTRAQLAGAYVVRAVAVRRSDAIRKQAETQKAQAPLSRPSLEVPGLETAGSEEKIVESLLKAAERARKKGNYRDAKELVDRVLDRDPRNETAWAMRLQIAEMAPRTAPAPTGRGAPVPLPQEGRGSRLPLGLLAAVLLLALLGVGGYYLWPDISRTIGEIGRAVLPAAANPTSTPTRAQQTLTETPASSGPSRKFETGFEVSSPFIEFWDNNGGAPIFGSPISARITETAPNGQSVEVQYFERARFELQSGADGSEAVTLGLLGMEVPTTGTAANPLPEGLQGDQVALGSAGITTPAKFREFWEEEGGLAIFGYPISPVLTTVGPDGNPLTVQYFERARFEYHPEAADDGKEVQLSPLGVEVYRIKHGG